MIIEFEIKKESLRPIIMGKLKSGCSCWNAAYFIG